jgi:hypothetical protein
MNDRPAGCEAPRPSNPSALLAIVLAARRTGDRLLEQVARRELQDRHGVRVTLTRKAKVPA